MRLTLLFIILVILSIPLNIRSQVIFFETFNEPNGATVGSSTEGIGWSSSCAGCSGTFSVNGGQFVNNNSKGVGTFVTNDIPVNGCSTISITIGYNGTDYSTSSGPFLDSSSKCSGCPGDPNNPNHPSCTNCWDFLLAEVLFDDGSSEELTFIGTTFLPSSTTINYTSACLNNIENIQISISSLTWAMDEFMNISDIQVTCGQSGSGLSITDNGPNSPFYCEGEDLALAASLGFVSYEWLDPSGNSVDFDRFLDVTSTSNFSNPQTYTVIATDAVGCKSFQTQNIIVNSTPNILLNVNNQNICEDETINLSENGTGNNNWTWAGPSSPIPSSTASNWTINNATPANSGTYSVTVTNSNGCTNSDEIAITVSPTTDYTLNDITLCITGTPFSLPTLNDGVTGNWEDGGPVTNNIFNPSIAGIGSHVITFIPNNQNCTASKEAVVMVNGPRLDPVSPVSVCNSYTLPPILGSNLSDKVAYFSMPNGQGDTLFPGDIILNDTILYLFDGSPTCNSEFELQITVMQGSNAGPGDTLELCAGGLYDLDDYLPSDVDQGRFENAFNGNVLMDGIVNAVGLGGLRYQANYIVDASNGCPADTAVYVIDFIEPLNAGPDTTHTVCQGSNITLNDLTYDNGTSGTVYFTSGGLQAPAVVNTVASQGPFTYSFYYVVEGNSICINDTALLTIHTLVNDTTYINQELCMGQQITVNGTVYDENRPSGTEIIFGTPSTGCDSIIYVDLTFGNEITGTRNDTFCGDQNILINGTTYNRANPTGTEMIAGQNGCDTTLFIDLMFLDASEYTLDTILCPNQNINFDGVIFDIDNPSGQVILSNAASSGCDSIINLNIDFDFSNTVMVNSALCEGDAVIINGNTYDENNLQGTEIIPIANGCDSVYIINLTVAVPDTSFFNVSFCADTTVLINGTAYNESNPSGMEIINGGSVNGCDSIVVVDLFFGSSVEVEINEVLCFGEERIINGTVYDASNPTGQQMISFGPGCDSIININFQFLGGEMLIDVAGPYCVGDTLGNILLSLNGIDTIKELTFDNGRIFNEFSGNDTIYGIKIGNYQARGVDENGCIYLVDFEVKAPLVEDLDLNIVSSSDDGYQLDIVHSYEIDSFIWSPEEGINCLDCTDPLISPEFDTRYYLEIINVHGCVYQDSIDLAAVEKKIVFQPNVFSPNDDGINDIFFLEAVENYGYEKFEIFDRWGNRVFSRSNGFLGNPDDGWDGRRNNNVAEAGVYVYYVIVELPTGPELFSGEVTLFR